VTGYDTRMKILVSGASGLIGSAFVRVLNSEADGAAHQVLRLVRHETTADDEIGWQPNEGVGPDPAALDGIDAVVHLAGAGLGDHRWSDDYKHTIEASRVGPTALLATTIAGLARPPKVFLSGSAIGIYGDTGDAIVDETAPAGDDFLAQLCVKWEAAAQPARDAGIRTVELRTGIVVSTKGVLLGKTLPLFRSGLGAKLGSGKQYVSWIARPDHLSAMRFLLDAEHVEGPVNLTAPDPVTNADYTKALASILHRPSWPIGPPAAVLKAALGEFADSIVTGQRVVPSRLLGAGFEFGYPALDVALRELIAAAA
jgi:uncharacterized protein (TIGR01777 family)